jgi:hypothetical protein
MRRARPAHGRGRGAAHVTALLEAAAERARCERTVARAVRVAWDVLAAAGPVAGGPALTAWQGAHGFAGPVEGLFGAVCLAAGSPSGVAASLYRAAGAVSEARKGAVA